MRSISKVLVTGGCGFIGSWTTDLLIDKGYEVMILDTLEPQVHGQSVPGYLNEKAKLVRGDVRDRPLLQRLVDNVDAVIHLAAQVGVGQSMYQPERYIDHNTRGTATLLDALVNSENDVKKLIVASSQSIYGEGKYHCRKCGEDRYPPLRAEEHLKNRVWEPPCPYCGTPLQPLPTDEDKPLAPTSIYSMSKRHQEEMCLLMGKTYGLPTVALRYFNAYGPRQALGNPYTGVCAIFSSRVLNKKPPYIFEDGAQQRDFVHVRDVARANVLALEGGSADYQAINIGTGEPTSIKQIAELLIQAYGAEFKPYISQRYRKGDVRHCYADVSRARSLMDYEPSIGLVEGLAELAEWGKAHGWGAVDLFDKALRELEKRKLAD